MNGAQHYQEAERLLTEHENLVSTHATARPAAAAAVMEACHLLLDKAQVHATLALAAATASPAVEAYLGDESSEPRRWTAVLG